MLSERTVEVPRRAIPVRVDCLRKENLSTTETKCEAFQGFISAERFPAPDAELADDVIPLPAP
jgi:hypothetical protein